METLKVSFEKELIKKLSQKSAGAVSEETVCLKAFKYFDLNNNGTVEADEFAKAIEKIGIMIPTQADLDALFSLYDHDGSGSIDYREFTAGVFGKESNATPQKAKMTSDELLDRLRKKLATRGARGIIGLGKQFRIMDDNHSMSLDRYEFTKAMQDYMLGFSEGEIATLFRVFDYDRSGLIEYNEFLRTIRGPMNKFREASVHRAFDKFDRDGSGAVDINDIRGVYSAAKHPEVISGRKTEDQVLQEFLETFEVHHDLTENNAPDGVVTREEFVEYYNNISASIDDDQYFALMINNAWNLDGSMDVNSKRGWGNAPATPKQQTVADSYQARPQTPQAQSSYQSSGAKPQQNVSSRRGAPKTQAPPSLSDDQLIEMIRQKIVSRGARGIMGLGRIFRIYDDNGNGQLDIEEATKAFAELRLGLTDQQTLRAFRIFDRDGSQTISYEEFLREVRGEMNDFRRGLALRAFSIMDRDGSGCLGISDIKGVYNASHHPDVVAGKRTEDEVLFEFLDTFEAHHSDCVEDKRDGTVTKSEWLEYYNNVSMSIDSDEYFALMMNNAWNLDGSMDANAKKGWAAQ